MTSQAGRGLMGVEKANAGPTMLLQCQKSGRFDAYSLFISDLRHLRIPLEAKRPMLHLHSRLFSKVAP